MIGFFIFALIVVVVAFVVLLNLASYWQDRAKVLEQINESNGVTIDRITTERDALLTSMNEMVIKEAQARNLLLESKQIHWKALGELKGDVREGGDEERKEAA